MFKMENKAKSSFSLFKVLTIVHVMFSTGLCIYVFLNQANNETRFSELENEVKLRLCIKDEPKPIPQKVDSETTKTNGPESTSYFKNNQAGGTKKKGSKVVGSDATATFIITKRSINSSETMTVSQNNTEGTSEEIQATIRRQKHSQQNEHNCTTNRCPGTEITKLNKISLESYFEKAKKAFEKWEAERSLCLKFLRAVIEDDGNNSICGHLRGSPGPRGLQGVMGPRGEKGDTFVIKITGEVGPQGPKGDKGDAGDQSGQKGKEGPRGCSGTMLVPPLFLLTPRSYVFNETDTAAGMSCNTSANPSAQVTWYRENDMLTGDRFIIHENLITSQVPRSIQKQCPSEVPHPVTQSTLVIKRPRGSDTGTYFCRARNIMGVVDYNMNLTVQVPVAFTSLPSNKTVLQGDNVILTCGASGVPSPMLTWHRKDGGHMPSGYSVVNGDLMISRITKNEEGTFVCVASNVLGSKTTEASVTVNIFPKVSSFLQHPLTVNEHQALVLPCNATGYPTPVITWRKTNGSLPENRSIYDVQSLLIKNVEYADRGEYVCTAENTVGTTKNKTTVFVRVAPKVTKKPNSIEFGYRTKTKIIYFEVFASPPAKITWRRRAMIGMDVRFRQENGSLLIRNVHYKDSGMYEAIAKNVLGSVGILTFLAVRDVVLPVFQTKPPRPVMKYNDGQSVQLTCSAVGVPEPVVIWKANNNMTITYLVTGSRSNKTLTIPSFTLRYRGLYTCVARNEFGVAEQQVYIITPSPCDRPLGMEDGSIHNNQITASSIFAVGYSPWHGRLNSAGAWAATVRQQGQYLQVDLGKLMKVTKVATQGSSVGSEWVTSYTLSFSTGGKVFKQYEENNSLKAFLGNSDRNTVVAHVLKHATNARYIRFLPVSWHGWNSMRVELYGCSSL